MIGLLGGLRRREAEPIDQEPAPAKKLYVSHEEVVTELLDQEELKRWKDDHSEIFAKRGRLEIYKNGAIADPMRGGRCIVLASGDEWSLSERYRNSAYVEERIYYRAGLSRMASVLLASETRYGDLLMLGNSDYL